MPMLRLILPGRGSFWKSSLRLRIGSPANGSTCWNMMLVLRKAGRARSGRERGLDVGLERSRRVGRRVALDRTAVLADQEFREVPLDRLGAEHAPRFARQPLPEGMRAGAVDLDLRHHREGDAVVELAEGRDLFVLSRVLRTELIGR